ncbi:MAG: putative metal-dependent hydrolase [Ferruginibacter sp.]
MESLQYPIGKYIEQSFSEKQLKEWLLSIQTLPLHLEQAILNLDEAQLLIPYREGGWNIQEIVHHVADSHMNAYIRFKNGLCEDNPIIKPYNQAAWANMPDSQQLPVNISITLLFALHHRWHEILKNMKREDWNRTLFHPEYQKTTTLWYMLGNYAWHGKHHVAHIRILQPLV